MNYLLPERLDRLAREYALGTLAGPARRRFESVVRASPAASMAVDIWRRRLSVLDLAAAPVQAPKSTWRGIERRLFAGPNRAASVFGPSGALQALRSLFSGRGLVGALLGAFVCVALLRTQPGIIGLEPIVDALPASSVGVLQDQAGKATLVASSRRQGRQLTVKLLQPLDVPTGHVAELWALPKDGAAPFPVGPIPAQGTSRLVLPDTSEKLFSNVARLAVSFEKAPSKAGDVPTGAYALIGNCVKVW